MNENQIKRCVVSMLAKYGSREAACTAIEDRMIRCKTAVCEGRLFYLAEWVWSRGPGYASCI